MSNKPEPATLTTATSAELKQQVADERQRNLEGNAKYAYTQGNGYVERIDASIAKLRDAKATITAAMTKLDDLVDDKKLTAENTRELLNEIETAASKSRC